MFLDPVDNDKQHQTGTNQTVGFDIGVLIREVSSVLTYINNSHSFVLDLIFIFTLNNINWARFKMGVRAIKDVRLLCHNIEPSSKICISDTVKKKHPC